MINLSVMSPQNTALPQMQHNNLTQLKSHAESVRTKTDEELHSVSRQFEAIFIHQLLKSMRSTVQKSGLFDSHATRMYESMHDQEMANLMTDKRSIGLADMVYKDLVRLEENNNLEKSNVNKVNIDINQEKNLMG